MKLEEQKVPQPLVFHPPMKSKGGLRKEFFGWGEIEEFWKKWVEPRIERGLVVEPKVDGFRTQLHKKGKETRIFLEESDRDFSSTLPEIKEILLEIPHDFIIDAETYSDEKRAVPIMFDLLYWDGPFPTEFLERRAKLEDESQRTALKEFLLMPSKLVRTRGDFLKEIEAASRFMNSEGAMLKEPAFLYVPGGREDTWSKLKHVERIRVKVLGGRPVRGMKAFRYECGVRLAPEEMSKFRREDIKRGCLSLGWTLNTKTRARLDENLVVEVSAIDISEIEERGGLERKQLIGWRVPVVKEVTARPAFNLEELYEAAQLLPGKVLLPSSERFGILESWTERWSEIEDYEQTISEQSSIEEKSAAREHLERIIAETPFYIERRYAEEVLSMVEGHLERQIESRREELRAELARLRSRLRELEYRKRLSEEELRSFREAANELRNRIEDLEGEIAEAGQEIGNVLGELDRIESEIQDLEEERRDAARELVELRWRLRSLQWEIMLKERELARVRAEIRIITAELRMAEPEERESLEELLDDLREEEESLEDELSSLRSELSDLEDEISELEDQLDEYDRDLWRLEAERSALQASLDQARAKQREAERKKKEAEADLAEIEWAISQLEDEIEELEREIENLRAEIESLEEELRGL